MDIVNENVVDVVLEDSGFAASVGVSPFCARGLIFQRNILYGWEVASGEDIQQRCLTACSIPSASRLAVLYCVGGSEAVVSYSRTSLRWTVLLPPHSGIVITRCGRPVCMCSRCCCISVESSRDVVSMSRKASAQRRK